MFDFEKDVLEPLSDGFIILVWWLLLPAVLIGLSVWLLGWFAVLLPVTILVAWVVGKVYQIVRGRQGKNTDGGLLI